MYMYCSLKIFMFCIQLAILISSLINLVMQLSFCEMVRWFQNQSNQKRSHVRDNVIENNIFKNNSRNEYKIIWVRWNMFKADGWILNENEVKT